MTSLLCSSSSLLSLFAPSSFSFLLLLSAPPPLSFCSSFPQTLDYETTTSYSLLMRARDQAPPFNENTANITITILDTNDNAPQFSMVGGVFLPPSPPVTLIVTVCLQLYMYMAIHAVSVLLSPLSLLPLSPFPPLSLSSPLLHTHPQVTLCKYQREPQSTSQLAPLLPQI